MIRCGRCGADLDDDARYCDQCGVALAREASAERLRLRNHTVGLDLRVEPGAVLGREEGAAAGPLAAYPAISARHCRVDRDADGRWRVTDLGSSNGTFVDEVRLPEDQPTPLPPGCFLRLANLELVVTPA